MIYLDYNASVPLRPSAREALLRAIDIEGNASSPHLIGRKVRSFIEDARQDILEGVKGKRLVFTSGGTEANILALSGLGSIPVLVSAIEHDSVLKAMSRPHLLPVTQEGVVNLEALDKILLSFEKPGLLSIMLLNNETGVIQPIQEATRRAHQKGWKVHTDASQALGHLPLSFEALDVDMMTLSSHKCGGPIGIGALILKEDLHLKPLIRGGGQEYGIRSGTLSAPLILGFAAALKETLQKEQKESLHLQKLQQKMEESLSHAIIYGKKSPRGSHVSCLSMPFVPASLQLMAFDLEGIAVSAGAACSSGTIKGSHVLAAMGVSPQESQCAIRVSMGWKTQEEDIDTFIQAWKRIYAKKNFKEAS